MNNNLDVEDGVLVSLPISFHKWRGLTVFHVTIYAALWVFAYTMTMPDAAFAAGSAQGVLGVQASVTPSAAFNSTGQFSISASNIERGFIEIPISSLFNVKAGNNAPNVSFEFQPQDDILRTVAIKSGEEVPLKELQAASDQQLLEVEDLNLLTPAAAGVLNSFYLEKGKAIAVSGRETAQQKRVSSAPLSLRFNLSESARSGSYTIPFVVSVQL